MKILFFDTETTGLPVNFYEPYTNIENWPRLVQLSWITEDTDTKEKKENDFIIRPEGFTIPEAAAKIHNITTEIAERDGVNLMAALSDFVQDMLLADLQVAHNIEFDKNVICSEIYRTAIKLMGEKELLLEFGFRIQNYFMNKRSICTMKLGTNYTKIKTAGGDYKWPKLIELYRHFFGRDFEGQHDALDDIRATRECFWEMVRLTGDENLNHIEKLLL